MTETPLPNEITDKDFSAMRFIREHRLCKDYTSLVKLERLKLVETDGPTVTLTRDGETMLANYDELSARAS